MSRRKRFDLFPTGLLGFTRSRRGKVQFCLNVLPLVAPEIHDLLAAPLVRAFAPRYRLGLSVTPPFGSECLTSVADVRSTMPSADFCLPARSPGVSSAAFGAQSPDLRSACLMDMDFAV